MRIFATTIVMCALASSAGAEPKFESPRTFKAKRWIDPLLAAKGSPPAPTKAKPLEYSIDVKDNECEGLKEGTATDAKALAKLKACVMVLYKGISAEPLEAQWLEYPASDLDEITVSLSMKFRKLIKAHAKDWTIIDGHYSGLGVNLDIYLALDAKNQARAMWVTEEYFE